MKISTDFFILCESTIIDSEKNSLNIMNVIDGATVTNLPLLMSGFKLASRYTIKDSDDSSIAKIELKMVTPDGTEVDISPSEDDVEYSLNFQPNTATQRTGMLVDLAIGVEAEGPHTIKAMYRGKEIAAQVLHISKEK
jgi:hypothetical protein